jgi:hypothetical protein
MEPDPRPANKLRKRSKSRDRQGLTMSGGLSGQPANTSQSLAPANNATSSEERKKSKFRLSNPFHSKEKDRESTRKDAIEPKEHNPKRDTVDTNFDSAYGSSEPSSSANPSFASNQHRASLGEQWNPPAPTSQAPAATTPPPPQQNTLAPPPAQPLQNRSSHENISRDTYRDAGTGNIVTTTTTVCDIHVLCVQLALTDTLFIDDNHHHNNHWPWWNYDCGAAPQQRHVASRW